GHPGDMSVQDKRIALPELEGIVRFVLDEARRQGAGQAEASAPHDAGLSVTARLGDVENIEYTNDRGVGVTVYIDSCEATASRSDFGTEALREAVPKACSIVLRTAPDPYWGLAEPELMETVPPDLGHARPLEIDADRATAWAVA